MKPKLAYIVATTISSMGWGLHFAFVTRYLVAELGGGTTATMAFIGVGWVFTLLGILAGKIANVIGERRAILLGVTQALPLITGIFVRDPMILATVLSTAAFPWVIHWSIVLKTIFSSTRERPGREYGEVTAGTGVGYAVGALISGPIYAFGGYASVFLLNALLLLVPPLMYYISYPGYASSPLREVRVGVLDVVRKTLPALLSLSLVIFSRELLYSLAPVKLSESLESVLPGLPEWLAYTLYGLVYSGGSLISPPLRLLAGRLVDSHGPLKVYVSTVVGYVAFYWSFTGTGGVAPLIIWQLPLYPFLDTAFNVYVARKLAREELVTGFGASYAFTAIGGSLVTLLLATGLGVKHAGILVSIAGAFSVLLILLGVREKK